MSLKLQLRLSLQLSSDLIPGLELHMLRGGQKWEKKKYWEVVKHSSGYMFSQIQIFTWKLKFYHWRNKYGQLFSLKKKRAFFYFWDITSIAVGLSVILSGKANGVSWKKQAVWDHNSVPWVLSHHTSPCSTMLYGALPLHYGISKRHPQELGDNEINIYCFIMDIFFFWLHPRHVDVPWPGIKAEPQQQPNP